MEVIGDPNGGGGDVDMSSENPSLVMTTNTNSPSVPVRNDSSCRGAIMRRRFLERGLDTSWKSSLAGDDETSSSKYANSSSPAKEEQVDRMVTEVNGTPSIALRKSLLHKRTAHSVHGPLDLSPNLTSLRSTPRLSKIRDMVEAQIDNSQLAQSFNLEAEKESPGLTRLRQTPGKPLWKKRQTIDDMHNETRKNADCLNIGGGVSIWPDMTNMRLSKLELSALTLVSLTLVVLTCLAFNFIHGSTLFKLQLYSNRLLMFSDEHHVDTTNTSQLSKSVTNWHKDYSSLIAQLKSDFTTSGNINARVSFYIYAVSYVSGISVLLFYLADNVWSKNKLSPNRIKKWVCLLAIIGSWTFNLCRLFVGGYMLERNVEENIYRLNAYQKELIYKDLDSTVYERVLSYWTLHYLSPNTKGTLEIFGVIPFNSVVHYLQYYSLPIITALISPVVKLVFSLLYIYGFIEHHSM